jgi:hypothetical protein
VDKHPCETRLIDWLIMMSEITFQNCGHQPACCSSLGLYVNMESHGVGDADWDNSWLVHQSSLAVSPPDTSGTSRRNGRRSENIAYQHTKYLKGSLTRRKILRHGTSGFTSHPKEVVLRIFMRDSKASSQQNALLRCKEKGLILNPHSYLLSVIVALFIVN